MFHSVSVNDITGVATCTCGHTGQVFFARGYEWGVWGREHEAIIAAEEAAN